MTDAEGFPWRAGLPAAGRLPRRSRTPALHANIAITRGAQRFPAAVRLTRWSRTPALHANVAITRGVQRFPAAVMLTRRSRTPVLHANAAITRGARRFPAAVRSSRRPRTLALHVTERFRKSCLDKATRQALSQDPSWRDSSEHRPVSHCSGPDP